MKQAIIIMTMLVLLSIAATALIPENDLRTVSRLTDEQIRTMSTPTYAWTNITDTNIIYTYMVLDYQVVNDRYVLRQVEKTASLSINSIINCMNDNNDDTNTCVELLVNADTPSRPASGGSVDPVRLQLLKAKHLQEIMLRGKRARATMLLYYRPYYLLATTFSTTRPTINSADTIPTTTTRPTTTTTTLQAGDIG